MLLTAAMSASVLAGCGSGGSAAQKEEPAAAESTQKEAAPAETKEEDTAPETESTEAATASADEKETAIQATSMTEKTDTVRTAQKFNNVQLQEIMKQLNKDFGVKVVFKNENARTIRLYLSWEADDKLLDIVNRINHFEKVHLTLSEGMIIIE